MNVQVSDWFVEPGSFFCILKIPAEGRRVRLSQQLGGSFLLLKSADIGGSSAMIVCY